MGWHFRQRSDHPNGGRDGVAFHAGGLVLEILGVAQQARLVGLVGHAPGEAACPPRKIPGGFRLTDEIE
jgi:hypothetical protein